MAKVFALDGAWKAVDKQMPLEDRTIRRERLNSLRKQQNMEHIIQKALSYCSSDESSARPDQDWFNSYINLAEDISNQTMQDLWAKILAGEIAKSGTYSLKALQVFRTMSINDAKLLAKASSLAIKDNSRKNIRLISGSYQKPGLLNIFNKNRQQNINLSQFGLNFADLLNLADNHLLFIQETESNSLAKGEILNFNYNGLAFTLSARKANCLVRFYKFTPIGVELLHLINDNPNDDFFTSLKQQLSCHFLVSQNNI